MCECAKFGQGGTGLLIRWCNPIVVFHGQLVPMFSVEVRRLMIPVFGGVVDATFDQPVPPASASFLGAVAIDRGYLIE